MTFMPAPLQEGASAVDLFSRRKDDAGVDIVDLAPAVLDACPSIGGRATGECRRDIRSSSRRSAEARADGSEYKGRMCSCFHAAKQAESRNTFAIGIDIAVATDIIAVRTAAAGNDDVQLVRLEVFTLRSVLHDENHRPAAAESLGKSISWCSASQSMSWRVLMTLAAIGLVRLNPRQKRDIPGRTRRSHAVSDPGRFAELAKDNCRTGAPQHRRRAFSLGGLDVSYSRSGRKFVSSSRETASSMVTTASSLALLSILCFLPRLCSHRLSRGDGGNEPAGQDGRQTALSAFTAGIPARLLAGEDRKPVTQRGQTPGTRPCRSASSRVGSSPSAKASKPRSVP